MKMFRRTLLPFAVAFLVAQVFPSSSRAQAATPQSGDTPIIYISDFDLEAVNGLDTKKPTTIGAQTNPDVSVKKDVQPTEQAQKIVTAMTLRLTKELTNGGYNVRPWPKTGSPPTEGVRIRGVFAEADEMNRIRKEVLGVPTRATKMYLFVGVSNLERPEQALYEYATTTDATNIRSAANAANGITPPSVSAKQGAVITVSPYAPVAKFEMDKNVTDESLKKTASDIVADLRSLLTANPGAGSQ